MASVEIREGFLCPICVQDLGSVIQLQDHFELVHAGEDRAVLNQLKGLFGKAKRKLLGKEIESGLSYVPAGSVGLSTVSDASAAAAVGGIDPALWEPQELGVMRSLTDSFKAVRGSRIDRFVIETNKLLIRLDKLVNTDVSMDPGKRKAFEKSVVSWAPDADVSLCMTCGRSFTLTRRRHHCRLCGRILCNKCSHFLPFDFAKKLTNPAFAYEGEGFRRSSSSSSLNSIFSPDGDVHIRTCNDCRDLLERRDEQMSSRNTRPALVVLYEKTHEYMDEADNILPQYLQIANALNAGDNAYSLEEAQLMRTRLGKLYETVATLTKRISTLGLDSSEPPSPAHLRLQQMIAAQASAFLQENLLSLPKLPTEEELERLHEAKRVEAQRRIAEERRVEQEQRRRREDAEKLASTTSKEVPGHRRTASTPDVKFNKTEVEVELLSGWKPDATNTTAGHHGEDPMVQQMNIIRGYIRQAQEARRWDEVTMLEENLRELQQEYWAQEEHQS